MKLEAKALEIRDRATCIPGLAIRMLAEPGDVAQEWLFHSKAGYPRDGSGIVLMHMDDQRAHSDPYDWVGSRTMCAAHQYIQEHFDDLKDGEVVDVRVILGEEKVPAETDRLFEWGRK